MFFSNTFAPLPPPGNWGHCASNVGNRGVVKEKDHPMHENFASSLHISWKFRSTLGFGTISFNLNQSRPMKFEWKVHLGPWRRFKYVQIFPKNSGNGWINRILWINEGSINSFSTCKILQANFPWTRSLVTHVQGMVYDGSLYAVVAPNSIFSLNMKYQVRSCSAKSQ